MAWEVWWALVLGFALSGIVQAWVPPSRIGHALGRARARRGGAGNRPRGGFVVLQLRGDRNREVDVREGSELRLGDGLPVRLDEPRVRARDRDLDLHRLAVHACRARGRPDPDRADVA